MIIAGRAVFGLGDPFAGAPASPEGGVVYISGGIATVNPNAMISAAGAPSFRELITVSRGGATPLCDTVRYRGSVGDSLPLNALDGLAALRGTGFDGVAVVVGAQVGMRSSEAWGVGAHGSDLRLGNCLNGSGALLTRFAIIGAGGHFVAELDDTYTIGLSGANRPRGIYLGSGGVTHASPTLISTTVALTDGAAAQVATLTNAPVAGNPSKWAPVNDNGVLRHTPLW